MHARWGISFLLGTLVSTRVRSVMRTEKWQARNATTSQQGDPGRLAGLLVLSFGVALLTSVALPVTVRATDDPVFACAASKLSAIGSAAKKTLTCYALAAKSGVAVDSSCLSKSSTVLAKKLAKADARAISLGANCPPLGDGSDAFAALGAAATQWATYFHPNTVASKCAAKELTAVGKAVKSLFKANSKNLEEGLGPSNQLSLQWAVLDASDKLASTLRVAETAGRGDCQIASDSDQIDSQIVSVVSQRLPQCDGLQIPEYYLKSAATIAGLQITDPWGEGLPDALARAGSLLSCVPPPMGEMTSTANARQADRDCSTQFCSDVEYCGPGNSISNPVNLLGQDVHPRVGTCLNRNCWDHDNCYGPLCVQTDAGCYFTGQGGSTECDATLLASCSDTECIASALSEGPATLFRFTFVCGMIEGLIGSTSIRPGAQQCSKPPCGECGMCAGDGQGYMCEGGDCDDGDACTVDLCTGGGCQHVPMNCDDQNSCTVDSCASGICQHASMDCDDGDACTVDSCQNGACVHPMRSCNDFDPCSVDSCVDGVCQHSGGRAECLSRREYNADGCNGWSFDSTTCTCSPPACRLSDGGQCCIFHPDGYCYCFNPDCAPCE